MTGGYGAPTVQSVRRDSERARDIVRACAEAVPPLEIQGRQLETWDDAHLMPHNDANVSEFVEHLRILNDVTGPRRERDRAALLVTARGIGCERYREYMTRLLAGATVPDRLDPASDTDFVLIEDTAMRYMREDPVFGSADDPLPPDVSSLIKRVYRDRARVTAAALGEDLPTTSHSFATNIVHAMVTEDHDAIYDPTLVLAMLGANLDKVQKATPEQIEILMEPFAWCCRYGAVEAAEIVEGASLRQLARMARLMCRAMLDFEPLPVRAEQTTIEMFAAIFAPFFMGIVQSIFRIAGMTLSTDQALALLEDEANVLLPPTVASADG
jgi:hypothetical protein